MFPGPLSADPVASTDAARSPHLGEHRRRARHLDGAPMTRDPGFTSIVTERLRLRRFSPRDVSAFHAYRADPGVARYQSWRDYTREQAERFAEQMARTDPGVPGEPFQFAVALVADDDLVGDCMLAIGAGDPPNAEIGYTIAPSHQGRGYATEAVIRLLSYAFGTHGVGTVTAVTDTRNAASIAVAERVGMRLVGSVHTTFKDEPCEEATYEITRGRWGSRG
jgi:RimJ/RimL family protein N-acetyltransferase